MQIQFTAGRMPNTHNTTLRLQHITAWRATHVTLLDSFYLLVLLDGILELALLAKDDDGSLVEECQDFASVRPDALSRTDGVQLSPTRIMPSLLMWGACSVRRAYSHTRTPVCIDVTFKLGVLPTPHILDAVYQEVMGAAVYFWGGFRCGDVVDTH